MNIALKKLQVPQCTTSRPVLIILRGSTCEGELSAKHFSREGSTRGATKEATGTVAYFVSYCDNDLLLDIDG